MHHLTEEELLSHHEQLSVRRKQLVSPMDDTDPMLFVVTRDKRAFVGNPGPLMFDFINCTGPFASSGQQQSVPSVALMSVLALMLSKHIVPATVIFVCEGYRNTAALEGETIEEALERLATHERGDFEHDFKNNPASTVEEVLMTYVYVFPDNSDAEPTISHAIQAFSWTDGGQLSLRPLDQSDPLQFRLHAPLGKDEGNIVDVGRTLWSVIQQAPITANGTLEMEENADG